MGPQVRGLCLGLAFGALVLLVGCQEDKVDMKSEKSPSIGKDSGATPSAPKDSSRQNPAAGYPKSAAGQGDALK